MSAHERATLDPPAADLLGTLGLRQEYDRGRELLAGIAAFEAEASGRLDQLADQARSGLWRNRRKLHVLTQARQQAALRAKDPDRYIAACDDRHDLSLELAPCLRDGAELPSRADLLALLKFFDDAQQAKAAGPAFWTLSVLREAELHLYEIFAAGMRRELRAAWQPPIAALHDHLRGRGSYAAYLQLLDMLFELGDLGAFETTYEEFRIRSGGAGLLFPWLGSLLNDDTFRALYAAALVRLLDHVIVVKRLRHRAGDRELAYLQRLREDLRAHPAALDQVVVQPGAVLSDMVGGAAATVIDKGPIAGGMALPPAPVVLPTPNIVGFKLPDNLARLKPLLAQVLAALAGDSAWDRRRAAVLGFWLAFMHRHTLDLEGCRTTLAALPVGTEALALLRISLRGELAFYAGGYEEAQLHHWRALQLAERLLRRFRRMAGASAPAAPIGAAQLFMGQLHQWRGNAFVALGDYGQAQSAYAQVELFLRDAAPEARLMHAVNQGNLASLRNNLIDHRGYVTYDPAELASLGGDTTISFLRIKLERNRDSLAAADRHYRAARALLPSVRSKRERVRWQAIIDANLGNIAWARAHLLAEVGRLPDELRADFGDMGTQQECYQNARTLYYRAYETASTIGKHEELLSATCLASAGELDLLLGDYSAAESASFQSLNLLGYKLRDDFDDLLDIEHEPYPEQSWRIYLTLARIYEARRQSAQARRAYERALTTVETLRSLIRSDEWQISALQSKLQLYECAMHFFYHAGAAPNAARMFELSEQLKGRAFLELLESTRLCLDVLVPQQLRDRRAALNAEDAELTQALRLANDDEAEQLALQMRQLAQKRQVLETQIHEAQLAEAGEINPTALTWKECQGLLRQQLDTILLSFTIGDDYSYLLVGDARGLEAFELPGRTAIELPVMQLMSYVTVRAEPGAIEFAALNRAIVQLLLGPAIDNAGLLERMAGKRIVIVPDAMLYYLPFELLLTRQPVDQHGRPLDFAAYRQLGLDLAANGRALCRDLLPFYMLHAGPISYAQSASVWQKLQTAPAGQPDRTALGVYRIRYGGQLPEGPGYSHAQELQIAFPELSRTSRIAQVLDGFGDPAGTLRLSAEPDWPSELQSTEGNFKDVLRRHRVRYLIFAGHGVYNDKYPQFSGIVFNMPRRRSNIRQDGFFGLKDIFDLRMPETELVFLVACQSGVGMLSRGEGVNALTRAFMHRGSPSVIASLWSVDVEASVELVELFFERLRARPDADKAGVLQAAKQALCAKSDMYAHPYWWAAFVLMGRR